MELDSKIYVAGHNGMVGSAIVRKLLDAGYTNVFGVNQNIVDLRNQLHVNTFFEDHKPEYVFLAAAKVGGIGYNQSNPAEFIYDNLQIQNNVIHSSYINGVKKLLFLGSACIYPKLCEQPIREEYLMNGYLEPTNEGYALAKIAGLKMCEMYNKQYGFNAISLMPSNLYGIKDNFNISHGHVIPSMINKFIEAKETNKESVILFGDGSPMREFLYVDDLADACVFLMNNYDDSQYINVGSTDEYSIKDLAEKIADKVRYTGSIIWDTSKPNGTPRRKLDNSKIERLGWKPATSFDEGLEKTIAWYLEMREQSVR